MPDTTSQVGSPGHQAGDDDQQGGQTTAEPWGGAVVSGSPQQALEGHNARKNGADEGSPPDNGVLLREFNGRFVKSSSELIKRRRTRAVGDDRPDRAHNGEGAADQDQASVAEKESKKRDNERKYQAHDRKVPDDDVGVGCGQLRCRSSI